MRRARENDAQWQQGKTWSLVYHAGDAATQVLKDAYASFFSENALNPSAFPSLRKFEAEVIAMTANLLGGDYQVVGNMTSGGTESILMAVKTARDWARVHKPATALPQMVLPVTAHPAFDKAAHYFCVEVVRTPVHADFTADVDAIRSAVTDDTVLIVGSAPSYPHGVLDPIAELAQIAQENQILFHTDACIGGFMLPFVRKLGYSVPDFDFVVPGVTSLSVDLHKYAYAAKGTSVILYRDAELRRHQFFVQTEWPGGIYASPTMAGTRPGGAIAAAWAIISYLGEEGYLSIAETVMETVLKLRGGIRTIDGVKVLGEPVMSILALGSEDGSDVYQVGDELTVRGWYLDRQQYPPSLHMTVNHAHAPVADLFLQDLREAVTAAKRPSLHRFSDRLKVDLVRGAVKVLPRAIVSRMTSAASSVAGFKGADVPQRSAAMYGMMAALPERGDLQELVLNVLDQWTRVDS
jgi:glutamate/tyrosine decarboxylase-like PLP-dependent enzyme